MFSKVRVGIQQESSIATLAFAAVHSFSHTGSDASMTSGTLVCSSDCSNGQFHNDVKGSSWAGYSLRRLQRLAEAQVQFSPGNGGCSSSECANCCYCSRAVQYANFEPVQIAWCFYWFIVGVKTAAYRGL